MNRDNEISGGKIQKEKSILEAKRSESAGIRGSTIASNITEPIKRLHCAYQLESTNIYLYVL